MFRPSTIIRELVLSLAKVDQLNYYQLSKKSSAPQNLTLRYLQTIRYSYDVMCSIKCHSISYNKYAIRTPSLISHKSTDSPQFKTEENCKVMATEWDFSIKKPDGILFPYRDREQYSHCKRPLTEEAILFFATLPAIFKSFFIIHSSLLRAMLLHRHR
jgi:hypothetical protein